MTKMIEYNESMERKIISLYVFYDNKQPIWLQEWETENTRVYSDVIDISEINLKQYFVAFISITKGEINYIAKVRRDKTVVTKKMRVFFEKVVKLNKPIIYNDLADILSPQMKASFEKMVSNSIYEMTANQWNIIVPYLLRTNSDQSELLKNILQTKKKKEGITSNRSIITNYEKDAIGLCLRLADVNNKYNEIAQWNIDDVNTPDFLKRTSNLSLREDTMIINDFRIFGDWGIIKEFKNNTAVFSNGINRISIMNVNRTPIETTMGVDLFYYNFQYKNYIFVQYKRMINTGDNYSYNIKSDSLFEKDISRMESIEAKLSKELSNSNISDYRLNNELFYFKFCKDNQEVFTKDLCMGMYLPKSYINYLVKNNLKRFSYETVDRYFNNTMFIEMVKSGLFGSNINESVILTEMIQQTLESGKSLILAVKNNET
mgnify:CR=1 FL=1